MCFRFCQRRSRGRRQVGAHAPGRTPWGGLKICVKLRIFLVKSCKSPQRRRHRALPLKPRWLPVALPSVPRVVTPAYWYSFVECIFSVKFILLLRKITQVSNTKCSTFASFILFCACFSLQVLQFLLVRAQKYFCSRAQGTLATQLVLHSAVHQEKFNRFHRFCFHMKKRSNFYCFHLFISHTFPSSFLALFHQSVSTSLLQPAMLLFVSES